MVESDFLKKQFDEGAEQYDNVVGKVLPYYREMCSEVIGAIEKVSKVLEFGIGTGLITLGLFKKFPSTKVDGVDLSLEMLAGAKERLKGFNVNFIEKDILDFIPLKKYGLCLSVLVIHHFEKEQKKKIFKQIFNCLEEGGMFILGDLVLGETFEETDKLIAEWKGYLYRTFGKEEGEKWFRIYEEEDLPEKVSDQLKWLKEVGFAQVECVWKKMNCAVLVAKK